MFRYAFKTSTWTPSKAEWLQAAQTISHTERTRISQFMFKRDAKHAMAGRLLMRNCFARVAEAAPNSFSLSRDSSGKPLLSNPPLKLTTFSFNVSHAGEYAVFVGSGVQDVGVDVMKVELRRNTSLDQFFSHMTRQFTDYEWERIRLPAGEFGKLFNFYRHWCLKESFVKTIGTGLKFGLKRIEFNLGDMAGDRCAATSVSIDGIKQDEWAFEEHFVDGHIVAVAVKPKPDTLFSSDTEITGFVQLGFKDLLLCDDVLDDDDYFLSFDKKKEIPC